MAKTLPPLGDLEHEIAQLIWAHGPMTAAAVRKALPRALKDPTIRTVLRRLEEKGYLKHEVDQGTFVYHAVETREQVAVKAVKEIADQFCGGSIEAVMNLMKSALLDPSRKARSKAR